ncbi:Ig-like domain repeat protein [Saccharolobus caldissimus]|uniref:Uncharacterized protein n=1 Tax=Saccharolobus caldissimus TaxID=1702097 RepID=A0AAQ4CNT6_9CREN|nr:Ig-like domain repeat protein [Saccharolobus caldissimus]BDB97467.1 hypothetical protein SACC_04840 [Saccharolobus caldissimus]
MRKALTILLIILVLPSLLGGVTNLIVLAAGGGGGGSGNSLSTFISTLQTLIPAALILLAILANRYDQRYALVLFAAALASAIFLAAAGQSQIGSYTPGNITIIEFNITGPTNVYVGDSYTWNIQSGGVTPSWEIENVSNSVVVASGSGDTVSWTPSSPGKYVIIATYTSSNEYGFGSFAFNAQPQPGPLGWITGAVVGAIKSVINAFIEGLAFVGKEFLSILSFPINYLVYSPTISSCSLVSSYFGEVYKASLGLAMLFIALSIAYNGIKGNYADLVDMAGDVIYKLTVWALFSSSGLIIYNYAANFLNYLISSTVETALQAASVEIFTGLIGVGTLFVVLNAVPFGFASDTSDLVSEIIMFYAVMLGIAVVRYAAIQALVALIPLISTLWIFEWTRGIAMALVDVLVGLMMAGVVSAFVIGVLASTISGVLFLTLAPVVVGADLAISIGLMVLSIKPAEHLAGAVGKMKTKD